MSMKIVVSYIDAVEKKVILKLLKPLLEKGYFYKDKRGKPYNHLYIQHKVYMDQEEENEKF